jgi:hypothetical protein
LSVVVTNGDAPSGDTIVGLVSNETLSGFTVKATVAGLVRINWMALGW